MFYKTSEKREKYNDYQGYASGHPETLPVMKAAPSGRKITANIISKDKTYCGVIEDVHVDETEYLLTYSINPENFKPEKIMTLNLQIPSGETLCITCDVKWFLKTTGDNKRLILGLKILGAPVHHIKFIKDFHLLQH